MNRAQSIDRIADTRKRSRYLQEVQKMKENEGIEQLDESQKCPVCGAKLLHIGGCLECPNKDYSMCG